MKKDRRSAAILAFCLAICLFLQGCAGLLEGSGREEPAEAARTVEEGSLGEQSPYRSVKIRYGYESLSREAFRDCYRKIGAAAYSISGEKAENGLYPLVEIFIGEESFSEDELRGVIAAFRDDFPEVFWLSPQFSYLSGSGGTRLQLYSLYSPEECGRMSEALSRAVEEILSGMKQGWTPFERELWLHDALLERCGYDREAAAQETIGGSAFTAYGALVEGKAVCQGYTLAMGLLLKLSGVESQVVYGRGRGEAHTWNLVKLDTGWYHLDVTWNDGEEPRYDYFNMDDEAITFDHEYSPQVRESLQLGLPREYPVCASLEESYYILYGIPVSSLGEAGGLGVIDGIAAAAEEKKRSVALVIGNNLDYNITKRMLFTQSPYKAFYWLSKANGKLGEEAQVETGQVHYREVLPLRVIVLELEYKD